MKVRFYVEKRRGDDGKLLVTQRPIFMTVSFIGNRVLISTGKKVDLHAWDQKQQKVVDSQPESREINQWLSSLKDTAIVLWNAMASLSENTGASEFRKEFERLRPRFSGRFFDIFLLYLDKNAERWSVSNYRKVRTLYHHLSDFEKSQNYPLSFKTINHEFLTAFEKYYTRQGKSKSTLWKAINTLAAFLNWATEEKYNIYNDYKGFYRSLQKTTQHTFRPIYLTWEELQVFIAYKTSITIQERVQDLFSLLCFTGMKFAELQRLTKTSIHDGYIYLEPERSKKRKIILNKFSDKIVEKYKNRYYPDNLAFPRISVISMNKYLREICSELGLRRPVRWKENDNETRELCDAITVTAAGNTFIYNALRLGVQIEAITSITGISRDKRIELLRSEMVDEEMNKFNKL